MPILLQITNRFWKTIWMCVLLEIFFQKSYKSSLHTRSDMTRDENIFVQHRLVSILYQFASNGGRYEVYPMRNAHGSGGRFVLVSSFISYGTRAIYLTMFFMVVPLALGQLYYCSSGNEGIPMNIFEWGRHRLHLNTTEQNAHRLHHPCDCNCDVTWTGEWTINLIGVCRFRLLITISTSETHMANGLLAVDYWCQTLLLTLPKNIVLCQR